MTEELKNKLMTLEVEPVQAVHPADVRQYMEWIVGTTKYLSNLRKIIYDVSFIDLYSHNGKIPEGCFAVDSFLYKIESWAHIDFPDRFMEILVKENVSNKGTCFYLDNKLYAQNVPLVKCDPMRDNLLHQRTDGLMWFEILKIVDQAGNTTLFYPSLKAKRLHDEAIQPKKKKHQTPRKAEVRN